MLRAVTFRFIAIFASTLAFYSVDAQHLLSDTISLDGVTIYQQKRSNSINSGIKSISVDSLIVKEKKALSLAELLQENSPIFIKTYGRGATATASFRGTGASHTNVYWNGIKINSPMSGEADFSLIPLYFVDNVAIHFGQSSMSFGSGGLGGAISLQSIPDWNSRFRSKIYQSVGSYQTLSTAASTSYSNRKFTGQTRVFRESSENNFSYKNVAKIGKPIEIQHNADYLKYGILQELYYRRSDKVMLSARVWAQETNRGIPQLMTNSFARETNRQNDVSINSVVELRKNSQNFSWKISSGISSINLNYNYNKLSSEGSSLAVLNANSNSLSWLNRISTNWEIKPWLTANLQAEMNRHWVESEELILAAGYSATQLQNTVRAIVNATPTERLIVSFLIGEELYAKFMTPISSSFAIKYKLFDKNDFFANGGISRNFHYPSLNDLHWVPGGNPNLRPEDALTVEAGFEHNTKFKSNSISADVNFFSSQITNWIMWLPHLKGYWEPVNLSRVAAQGVELSLSYLYQHNDLTFKLRGSYSNTQSTIENAEGVMRPEAHGRQLPFIPVHSGGLVTNVLWRKFHFVYSFTHYSERYTTTSNNPNSLRRLYPYYMSSAAFGWDFFLYNTPFALQLRVDNLFDESYQTILWRPMPGRNFNLVLRIDL
jgi:outer membrane cobalamin receptor